MENLYLSTLSKDGNFNWWDINHNSRESSSRPLLVNVAARVSTATDSATRSRTCNGGGRGSGLAEVGSVGCRRFLESG